MNTLLISGAFALRQRNGAPVYTSIETREEQYKEHEIDDIIDKLNNQRKVLGLTVIRSLDDSHKKLIKKIPKKIRIKTDHSLDLHKLERIIITPNGKGYLSTYFLDFMKEYNVPIYFVNSRGMIDSCFMPLYSKRPSLVVKQCEARINGKNVEIAKYIMMLKIESQEVRHLIPDLNKAKNIKEILVVEGHASKIYFQQWDLPTRFIWKARCGRSTSNENAVDPVNSVLNLGYGLLAQQMSEILLERGFELSIGLIHYSENYRYWNQLSYDMIEPYRIMIDNKVKDMVRQSIFEPEDFTFTKDRSHMILKNKPFERVLDRFLQALNPLEHESLPMIKKIENMM